MSNQQMIRLMRQGYEAFQQGDLETIGDLLAGDIIYHVPGRSPLAQDYLGKAAVFGFWARQHGLTNGHFRLEVVDLCATDNYGFARVIVHAQRNGQSITAPGVNVMRFREGKIAEFWSYTEDQYALDTFWS